MRHKSKAAALLMVLSLALSSPAFAAGTSVQTIAGNEQQILSEVTTLSGSGLFDHIDGASNAAAFRNPKGIAVSASGDVTISDSQNHLIRNVSSAKTSSIAGIIIELDSAGLPIGALVDGSSDKSLFNLPQGLAYDSEGHLYVADTGNHSIRKISPNGQVETIAGDGILGSRDGKGDQARFNAPSDVAVHPDGTLYVTDTLNHTIRKISTDGTVTTLNESAERPIQIIEGVAELAGDYKDGPLKGALFNEPHSIVVDQKGNLIVSDSGNHRLRYIDLQSNRVSTIAGGTGDVEYEDNEVYAFGSYVNGSAEEARFDFPKGLAITDEGGIVIADSFNHAVRYVLNGKVYTIAGGLDTGKGRTNGIDLKAQLYMPHDVAVMGDDIYVADSYNNMIRKISLYTLPEEAMVDGISVVLGNEVIEFDAKPEISNSRTMVPVRAVTEALGYEVDYSNDGKTVTLSKAGMSIVLSIGDTKLVVRHDNVETVKSIDAAPYTKQDRTYVPLRFFSEEAGLDVQWNSKYRAAILR